MVKPLPIATPRLILREFRPEDEPDIHAYASDPEITEHTAWGPTDIAQSHACLTAWIDAQDRWPREAVPLAIELDGHVIGSTGFSSIDFETLTGVFGYVLHKDHWGNGYEREAVDALLDFGFNALALHRIIAECFAQSPQTSGVLEAAGMRREGAFKQNARKQGEWHDTFCYAMLHEEWTRRPRAATSVTADPAPAAEPMTA
jgi:ribosomal-protein-alanine N-acetyltransferase